MKKFLVGLILGGIISITIISQSYANSDITAVTAPSKVVFHFNDASIEIDTFKNDVIYYQNRVYIPLRSFSDAIGANIEYKSASETSAKKNLIDVYLE